MNRKLKGCDLSVLNMTKALTKNIWEEKKFEHQKRLLQRDHRREIFLINRELREVKNSLREIRAISGYCHETRTLHFNAVSRPTSHHTSMQDSLTIPTELDREIRQNKIQNAEELDMICLRRLSACEHDPRERMVIPKLVEEFGGQSHQRHISSKYETYMSSEFVDGSLVDLKSANLNARNLNDKECGENHLAKFEHAFVCKKGLSELATKQKMANEDFTKLSVSNIEHPRSKTWLIRRPEEEFPATWINRQPRTSSAYQGQDHLTHNEPVDFQVFRVERSYCCEGVMLPAADVRCNLYQGDLPSVPSETFKKPLVRNQTARFSSTQHSGTKDSAHARMSKPAARQTLQILVQQYSQTRLTYIEKEKQVVLSGRVSEFVRRLAVNS